MRSAVGPVPETDTTVASQSSYTKVFASGGSFQDVCGELIGVGQDRPSQRPSLISNLLWGAFLHPTDIDFRSNLTPLRHFAAVVTAWLLAVNTSVVQMPLPLTKRTLFSANFACRVLLCVWICMVIEEMKIAGKKSKSTKNSSAVDDRQLAADKTRPISIEFSTSFAKMHCG